jgi:hypothetical protein
MGIYLNFCVQQDLLQLDRVTMQHRNRRVRDENFPLYSLHVVLYGNRIQ